ncbi:uncharacterized protein LOC135249547 [Anguilla rostrata]|uniref:uncharacterized protein LOC135249547 n=1 Tax=Anguilla rostrata TaxID=7938 RepID=UPI0030D5A21C
MVVAVCLVVSKRPVSRLKEAPPSRSIPTVAFLVVGALLFLLLVVLGILLLQNRGLRRALSQRDHAPLHEAVYEELRVAYQRIRPLGEGVGDSEGHSLSDSARSSQKSPCFQGSGDGGKPENYDDVIPADKHPDSVAGELVEGDAPEHYDDVITMQLGPDAFPGDHVTDTEENYDDAVTGLDPRESVLAETPPAPSGMDYDDVGE